MTHHASIPHVGAQDPELKNSPIAEEGQRVDAEQAQHHEEQHATEAQAHAGAHGSHAAAVFDVAALAAAADVHDRSLPIG